MRRCGSGDIRDPNLADDSSYQTVSTYLTDLRDQLASGFDSIRGSDEGLSLYANGGNAVDQTLLFGKSECQPAGLLT